MIGRQKGVGRVGPARRLDPLDKGRGDPPRTPPAPPSAFARRSTARSASGVGAGSCFDCQPAFRHAYSTLADGPPGPRCARATRTPMFDGHPRAERTKISKASLAPAKTLSRLEQPRRRSPPRRSVDTRASGAPAVMAAAASRSNPRRNAPADPCPLSASSGRALPGRQALAPPNPTGWRRREARRRFETGPEVRC
jgi:hypothetical protein